VQAAAYGLLEVTRFLVSDLGADVNQADDDDNTPLYAAAQMGNVAVARCLLTEFGADVNLANQKGATPLYLAAQKGHVAVVRCLAIEFGADVTASIRDGATALQIASQNGHLAVMRCLIEEHGADVNHADMNGRTPLMEAARKMHKKIIAYLLKHGADPQISAPTYGTAVDVSKNFGTSEEQTKYLEAKTHCSNPGCAGSGIKKCTGCKQVRYCGQQCQLAHWPAHKADCKDAAKNKSVKID
jgi:ankyrin repeat protein